MSHSLAALYCVYNDFLWLKYSLRSVYELMDRIYFLISDRPWFGPRNDNSRTLRTIDEFPDPLGKISIVEGSWASEVEQRNASLVQAGKDGFAAAFVVDADEIYETSELRNFLKLAGEKPDIAAWHVCMFTYWKSLNYRICPPEPHAPAVLLKIGETVYNETRNVAASSHEMCPAEVCLCHHMSYAWPDDLLQMKHIWYPGHSQSMLPDWYEKKWKAWDRDHTIQDLHPVNPPHFKGACEQPRSLLPSVLKHIQNLPDY